MLSVSPNQNQAMIVAKTGTRKRKLPARRCRQAGEYYTPSYINRLLPAQSPGRWLPVWQRVGLGALVWRVPEQISKEIRCKPERKAGHLNGSILAPGNFFGQHYIRPKLLRLKKAGWNLTKKYNHGRSLDKSELLHQQTQRPTQAMRVRRSLRKGLQAEP